MLTRQFNETVYLINIFVRLTISIYKLIKFKQYSRNVDCIRNALSLLSILRNRYESWVFEYLGRAFFVKIQGFI